MFFSFLAAEDATRSDCGEEYSSKGRTVVNVYNVCFTVQIIGLAVEVLWAKIFVPTIAIVIIT